MMLKFNQTLWSSLKTIAVAILILVGGIFIIGQVFAYTITQTTVEDRNDFVVEPAKQEVILDPTQTEVRYIGVTSRIKTPTTFRVEIEDIIGSQDPNTPVLLLGGDKSPYSLKDYLHPDIHEFTLKFGEHISIPITIDLPKPASPGGFYAAAIISNAPSKEGTSTTNVQSQAKTISRIGSLFFVRVTGPVNQNGHLADFKIKDSKPIYERGNLTFQIYFKNEGNVHLVPYGTIDIKNMWGQTITTVPVDAYFSLPQSLRYREVFWSDPLAFGRYSATLHLHRGYGDTVDEKTISFWIIPYKYLLIALLVILILVALIYFFVKNFEWKKR
jgi:hypothetical protein